MNWWKLSFYLLVLLAVGGIFSARKESDSERGTFFDLQHWSIWIGIFAAATLKSVSVLVLWSPWSFRNHPMIVVIYLAAEVATFIGLLLFFQGVTQQPIQSLGLSSDRLGIRVLFGLRWIIAAFLIGYGIFYAFLFFQTFETSQKWLMRLYQNRDLVFRLMHFFEKMWGLSTAWIPALFMVVLRPLFETVVFWGLLYGPIRRKSDPIMAALITSILFMMADGSYTGHHLLAGVLSAYLYERTESLVPAMILQGLINLTSVLSFFEGRNLMVVMVRKTEAGWMAFLFAILLISLEIFYRFLTKRGHHWQKIGQKLSQKLPSSLATPID
ncbi:MAG: CPBP family intramembrane glutamic endopeptidase [Candidatus Manganitrophaceae bacterium]